MSQRPTLGLVLSLGALAGLGSARPATAQIRTSATVPSTANPPTGASRPDLVVLQALMANPITAPYRISTSMAGNQVALAGRVGTKRVHDVAIQTAIASGYPVRDNLTIDTAEAHRVAAYSAASGTGGPMGVGLTRLGVAAGGGLPYVYPPPLFGRLDNPFYGFEPPLVSYPPWWNVANNREANSMPAQGAPQGPTQGPTSLPYTGANPVAANPVAANPGVADPQAAALNPTDPQPTVEMTIDPRGVAVLRGTVPTLADRIAIGQTIAQQPGVSEVHNLLNVGGPMTQATNNTPPPPPQPAFPNAPGAVQPEAGQDAPRAAVPVDAGGELNHRLVQAIARRPALASLPIKVSVRDGIAYLSGNVPTVYEAMLAFRAAQQTPGVREVDDRLGFDVPDGERPNPLRQKGRPEDVEPYLAAQIRRQLGDMAHVDQVRLLGDTLEIRGTLLHEDDRPRLAAVLRSMPVLRGYRIEPTFQSE